MIINKKMKDMCTNYKCNQDLLMHDWWIALIGNTMGIVKYLPKSTILYRQHSSNVVGSKSTLTKIKNGYNLEKIYISLNDTRKQAESFLNTFEELLTPENVEIIESYIRLYNASFFDKNKLFKKYKFKKSGTIRNMVFKSIVLSKNISID